MTADLPLTAHVAEQLRRAGVDDEVGQLDRGLAGGQREAAAVVLDLALHVRVDAAGLVVGDVATGDREDQRAGLGQLGVADDAGGQLQAVQRVDEAGVEGDRGALAGQPLDLATGSGVALEPASSAAAVSSDPQAASGSPTRAAAARPATILEFLVAWKSI